MQSLSSPRRLLFSFFFIINFDVNVVSSDPHSRPTLRFLRFVRVTQALTLKWRLHPVGGASVLCVPALNASLHWCRILSLFITTVVFFDSMFGFISSLLTWKVAFSAVGCWDPRPSGSRRRVACCGGRRLSSVFQIQYCGC